MSSTETAPDGYVISTDLARLDFTAMHAYLSRSYWSPGIPLETVQRAARNSLCFGLYQAPEGRQVGLARVVTDHATFAYLCDVYVLEAHRGRGLGKFLIRTVMSHAALTGARRVMLATRDAHGLYRTSGFKDVGTTGILMEIVRNDIYSSSYGSVNIEARDLTPINR
jgi:GNAT superfamily N-acetyltransferase